jgi:hypothetical protein
LCEFVLVRWLSWLRVKACIFFGVVWEWFEGDVIRSGFVRFVLVFVDRGMGRVGRE